MDPGNADAAAGFRKWLRQILIQDPMLLEDAVRTLNEASPGLHQEVSAVPTITIGGSVTGSVIVTGDANRIRL